MRTAIIFPGNLDCYRFSIESVVKNLVEPNDADVFILASRKAYLKRVGESLGGANLILRVTAEDEKIIRDHLGDRLKVLAFTDDIPDYEEETATQHEKLHERISWLNDSGKFTQYYDRENKRLYDPQRYLDRFVKMKYLVKLLEDYETENDVVYDWIMRARIDFLYDNIGLDIDDIIAGTRSEIRKPKGSEESDEEITEALYWDGLDALWFGTPRVSKYILSNLVERVGGFPGGTITDKGDYRLDRNFQVNGLISSLPFGVRFTPVNIPIGATLQRGERRTFIPNYPVVDLPRRDQKILLEDYYTFSSGNPVYYQETSPDFPYFWIYTYYKKG